MQEPLDVVVIYLNGCERSENIETCNDKYECEVQILKEENNPEIV